MSFAATDTLESLVLSTFFIGLPYTFPAGGLYVGLYMLDPGESGIGPEVVGGGYARQSVTFGALTAGMSSEMQVSNTNAIAFDPASSAWGTVTHYGVFDAPTGGNCLIRCPLTNPFNVVINTVVTCSVGSLIVNVD